MSNDAQFHVAGVLAHVRPELAAALGTSIARISGAVVHQRSAEGKLVITLEGHEAGAVLAALREIQDMRGVLSAVLVYQHSEPLDATDEIVNP